MKVALPPTIAVALLQCLMLIGAACSVPARCLSHELVVVSHPGIVAVDRKNLFQGQASVEEILRM
jgi:hypothetical protein